MIELSVRPTSARRDALASAFGGGATVAWAFGVGAVGTVEDEKGGVVTLRSEVVREIEANVRAANEVDRGNSDDRRGSGAAASCGILFDRECGCALVPATRPPGTSGGELLKDRPAREDLPRNVDRKERP